eukprot:5437947-Amphidinium_carterae.1
MTQQVHQVQGMTVIFMAFGACCGCLKAVVDDQCTEGAIIAGPLVGLNGSSSGPVRKRLCICTTYSQVEVTDLALFGDLSA